jgi:hypothetical protein
MFYWKSVLAPVVVLPGTPVATASVAMLPALLAMALLIPAALGCSMGCSMGSREFDETEFVAIEFVTVELPWAPIGKDYSPAPLDVRTSGECPLGGLGFAVIAGALPPGIELSRLGYFSGTASRAGSYDFTIRAANGCSWTAHRFTLLVTEPPALGVKPERIQFQAVVGEGSPPAQLVHVTATWPHLPYEISISGGDWVKALPDQGRSPGPPGVAKKALSDTSENMRAPNPASTKKKKSFWPFKSDAKKTRPADASKNSPEDANNKDPQDGDKTRAADPDNKNPSDAGKPGETHPQDAGKKDPKDAGKRDAGDPGRKDSTGGDQAPAIPAGDTVHIRIDASNLKPGYYAATITFSAWQAAPASVLIELAVLSK